MPRRPSGSIIKTAKLFVPAGGFDHSRGGDMSPPRLSLPHTTPPAYLSGSVALSLKAGEDSVKCCDSASAVLTVLNARARTSAAPFGTLLPQSACSTARLFDFLYLALARCAFRRSI